MSFNDINVGDIVRLRFKSLPDLLKKDISTGKSLVQNWRISSNLLAMYSGGDFLVIGVDDKEKTITIENHLDDDELEVSEFMLDYFEKIDASHKFTSRYHGLNLVIHEGNLFINGRVLKDDDEGKNLTNFLYCIERYMTSVALEKSLAEDE